MKVSNKVWDQCGNAQAAVDSKKQIIVVCDVSDEINDKQQFEPMLNKAQENVDKDKTIRAGSADSSYYSESNAKYRQAKRQMHILLPRRQGTMVRWRRLPMAESQRT